MNTYGDRTTTLIKGDGAYLWDDQGNRYLDALCGIAVTGLGHNHPAVSRAICDQANTLLHASNLYNIGPQIELGKALTALAGMDAVFFSNSGAEANEVAIKIARKAGQDRGIASPEIITAENSFHGRTMATLSATGNPKVKTGFAPLLAGFVHAPFDDLHALEQAATENTVAIMVEPVQGEGGVRIPNARYLTELRQLCDQRGWLLILDEIQTGNGRTGKYFAFQHSAVVPDVVTTAKGLGNGVPIGACLAKGVAAEILQPGNHGSTFGGNPLACRAALAVVETLQSPGYLAHITELGQHLLNGFKSRLKDDPKVKDIRGFGLLLGIELAEPCPDFVERAKSKGLLVNMTAGSTIRLLPPFILTYQQADQIIETVSDLIKAL